MTVEAATPVAILLMDTTSMEQKAMTSGSSAFSKIISFLMNLK
nr:MAG TPA: hypothetical protein [Bacteriophage sp.]